MSSKKMDDCPICCDSYTIQLRKAVKCQYCDFTACTLCQKKYITEGILDAHCMSCRRAWNDDFLDMNFTKAFRTGPYRKHREDVLLEREISLLPTRQTRVEAKVRVREAMKEQMEVNKKLQALEVQRQEIMRDARKIERVIVRYDSESRGIPPPAWTLGEGEGKEEKERAKFIMKCPDAECRGFLSSAYKCGTCQLWFCPDCLVSKGDSKENEHTCDEGTKATVALIVKESKPCPKCGERISKIDGCFGKDIPVLLWNGACKMSQDIRVGEELVGDDGKKRIVQQTCRGEDELFEITQNRGMTYVVNSKHKLALKPMNVIAPQKNNIWIVRWYDEKEMRMRSKQCESEEDAKEYMKSLNLSETVEIVVDDYMKLSNNCKNNLYGYKASEINWPKKEVVLDPYIMGVWIGDGINNGIDFACCPQKDPEILKYLLDWCNKNHCEVVHDDAYRFRVRRAGYCQGRDAIGRGTTSETCKGCSKLKCDMCDLPNENFKRNCKMPGKNPLKEALEHYNLIRNKNIPEDYICNDRETRLQLLAGLVDTDGYVNNDGKRIIISQSNHKIGEQIALVAQSLGFVVSVGYIKKENVPFPGTTEKKSYAPHISITISGKNLSEIPTKVSRKKCVDSTPNKDYLKTSISVKGIGRGEYFGWDVGSNHKFLLKDMSCQVNCNQMFCTECHTAFDWVTGLEVKGVIHNPHYYEYLRSIGGGEAPRNAGDVPCGGVPYFNTLRHALKNIDEDTQRIIMNVHRITAEINDYRLGGYQGNFNMHDNGDLGVLYLLKDISKEDMKKELGKREVRRAKHLAIRAVLEMFMNTSTIMLNRIVTYPPKNNNEFEPLLNEFLALKKYVNDSLLNVSKMKMCSVPQIGKNDDNMNWNWLPFNKSGNTKKTTKKVEKKEDTSSHDSTDEEDN